MLNLSLTGQHILLNSQLQREQKWASQALLARKARMTKVSQEHKQATAMMVHIVAIEAYNAEEKD